MLFMPDINPHKMLGNEKMFACYRESCKIVRLPYIRKWDSMRPPARLRLVICCLAQQGEIYIRKQYLRLTAI